MSEHEVYAAKDFTQEEIARRNSIAVLVVGHGLQICKHCGHSAAVELTGLCPKRSTDLEKVKTFLAELGLTYEEDNDAAGDDSGVTEITLYGDSGRPQYGKSDLPVNRLLDGHGGFYGRFEFQPDGKFIQLGFWE